MATKRKAKRPAAKRTSARKRPVSQRKMSGCSCCSC